MIPDGNLDLSEDIRYTAYGTYMGKYKDLHFFLFLISLKDNTLKQNNNMGGL